MPSFYFEFGAFWFEVQPNDFCQPVDATDPQGADGTMCTLRIIPDSSIDHWDLGIAFMQGWYTIHQYSASSPSRENRMGFSPTIYSTKSKATCTTLEACEFTNDTNDDNNGTGVGTTTFVDVPTWTIMTTAFGATTIIGIMLAAYLLCPSALGFRRKRKVNFVLSHHDSKIED